MTAARRRGASGAIARCPWAKTELSIPYHDEEWGVPVRDERTLFEFLILEGAQAGLSWETILKKREGYRAAFDGFDPETIARWNDARVEKLLGDARIVRNRLKVESTRGNARALLALREAAGGSRANMARALPDLLWSFVGGEPIVNEWKTLKQIPARTAESDAMSKALKKLGFRFVGSTICYALMQATGMVNDHLATCPRRRECMKTPARGASGRRAAQ